MKNFSLVIVGAGASGMFAAINAAYISKNSFDIILLERMDRVGKKILATGNGRCNFTNINTSISNYHGNNPSFVKYSLEKFSPADTISAFDSLGVFSKIESEGKVYPYSDQASSILDCLRNEIERLKIKIINNFDVKDIKKSKEGFKIISFNSEILFADRIIIASGGCVSSNLGSNGYGFRLLEKFNHRITELVPALVQIKTDKEIVKGLKGIKFTGSAEIVSDNKKSKTEYGEILFTDYGLSGPPIFQLSIFAAYNKNCIINLDFMPLYEKNKVCEILLKRRKNLSHMSCEFFLTGLLNKRVGNIVMKKAGIEKLSFPVKNIDDNILNNAASLIKKFSFNVIGLNGFNNAQITVGGADTSQFDCKTMESKIVKGLYAAGEVFDIAGDCGGYNLQWAWSSGYIAGVSAAKSLK